VLEAIGGRLEGALAILSGRDAGDLARRVPGGLWRIGNHGLIPLAPGAKPPEDRAAAPDAVRGAIEKSVPCSMAHALKPRGPFLLCITGKPRILQKT
jgi:trehalose 6-phosphate phosphatase